jgi:formylglycine-generating enzyme required for sulfatase activity
MGASDGEPDQQPIHDEALSAFEVDATEVTVFAWWACVQAGRCTAPNTGADCNWGRPDREDNPVNCVDLAQSNAFCGWAGKRLPTEAEWEFAARGAEGRRYPWGDANPGAQLCWKRFDMAWGKVEGTCPVGTHLSGDTPTGIHDLAGNVWEWTSSRYCPYGAPSCTRNEIAIRGGSRGSSSNQSVRSTARSGLAPTERSSQVGLRCVKSI